MTFSPQLVARKPGQDNVVLYPGITYGKARWFHENFIETFDTKRESQLQMTLNFNPVGAGLSV